jgi:8-oxo-dGTP diphosphatase
MSKPHIRVVAAEIEDDGKFLITQRPEHATMPLLWEFPGGRVEPGETDEAALGRELREEMGISVSVFEQTLHVRHDYDNYTVDFVVYRAETNDQPRLLKVRDARWVSPDEFDQYEFPGADQASVARLLGLAP